ncbi:MAG: hypothetical protein KAU60_12485 [Desulfobacterales bacterium]|nr:hypothetical protein [Desulfobacterales bacterium]
MSLTQELGKRGRFAKVSEDMLKLAWTIPDENRKIASGTRHSHEACACGGR